MILESEARPNNTIIQSEANLLAERIRRSGTDLRTSGAKPRKTTVLENKERSFRSTGGPNNREGGEELEQLRGGWNIPLIKLGGAKRRPDERSEESGGSGGTQSPRNCSFVSFLRRKEITFEEVGGLGD